MNKITVIPVEEDGVWYMVLVDGITIDGFRDEDDAYSFATYLENVND